MKRHILFIVENNPIPFDKRVFFEALAAKEFGYEVTIISPKGKDAIRSFEIIDGINVYRHNMPIEGGGKLAFLFEYLNAIFWELVLCIKIYIKKPFHIIHSANPPDHVFIIALLYFI